ncbi:hypothetical protein Clacol_008335 [Clathrus columnatus]|uniref:Uncharacterized protein n=1 Tax=Clathrus columnatus TaxID=1419009 RepID=A0AAV5ALW0_9AGAM|nr:hypothetical protein Clacol_008335 [Clathrus columnatus]
MFTFLTNPKTMIPAPFTLTKLKSATTASVAAGTVAYAATMPVIVGVMNTVGFTSAGVAAGSLAAAVQGPVTVAGSPFAVMQALGATGAAVLFPVVPIVVGVGAVDNGLITVMAEAQ